MNKPINRFLNFRKMKKVILTGALMLLLMSFTNKSQNEIIIEETFSPECFEYADTWTSWKGNCAGFNNDLAEFDYWQQQYDDCEKVTNNDEFQFPN